ncbi:MAG: hypothetical protein F4164_08005 [Gemmatimonadales bacterium]|nr:hypothetical protein [Gemmatimonadales bacterium]MYG49299.1 hypothetical protein [Gemmatimonadales bacterium]MYK00777.1 hypothetical protein [Candidatus Palauibacter ramosifaciens]
MMRDSFGLAAFGFALLHLILGFLVFEPTLFPGGDNAGYLILGDALRNGEGYRDLYLPGTPLHARYPPLLPVMLAGLGWIGGVLGAKIGMLLMTTLVVWATAHFGRQWMGAGPALAAAGLLAVNPTLLEYGHYVLSEGPFVLWIVAALWLSQRDDGRGALLAMGAAIAAFATRTAGMTVLMALPLAWLLARRYRRAGWTMLVAVATLAAWALYQRWAAADQPGYLSVLLLVDPYSPEAGTVTLAGLIERAAQNLWAHVSRVLPDLLLGPGDGSSGGRIVLGGTAAAAALFRWTSAARGRLGAPEIFAILYVGLIALWPSVWTDRRFLLPLLPVVLLLALSALWRLPLRPPVRWLRLAVPMVFAAFGVIWAANVIPGRVACIASYRADRPCDVPASSSLYASARWARENTPPEAVIANRKPRLFYWYSRRRGDVYPFSADAATVMAGLDAMGASYVVVDQVSGTTGRYLIPAIRAFPNRFEAVYEGGEPVTVILRLLPAMADIE